MARHVKAGRYLDLPVPMMYMYIVERTQIYLTARESAALDAAARRTGRTRSHLIRDAIEATYLVDMDREEQRRALLASAGAWSGRRETGELAVERLRSGRLARLHKPQPGRRRE